jgi:glycosyltransferase involved in cell wall biosynthesis
VKPCALVPVYNHGEPVGDVVRALVALDLPCLVVDDGSDEATRRVLADLARDGAVAVERLDANRGRGAALRHGYRTAWGRGFTHVVQVDADGQHDVADVPRFLEAARRAPDALVLGAPVFDASAPRSRLYGRRLSVFWVRVETLSAAIRDPLCGFRCLPLAPTVALLARRPLGDRMEFDVEIVVRLAWEGVPVVNVPTRVRYFAHGVSHFQPWGDNVRISLAHARLTFGMLRRVPGLLSPWARGARVRVRGRAGEAR